MGNHPVTLGDLIAADKLLWVYCRECGHERDLNPAMVPLPADTRVPDIGKHMKCSVCGSRKIPSTRRGPADDFSERCPGQGGPRVLETGIATWRGLAV
jgi:hypothetical protein